MQQSIKPIHHKVNARLNLPGSKSISNRVLLLAALAKGRSHLSNLLLCDDTEVMLDALQRLGVKYTLDTHNHNIIIDGCDGVFPTNTATIQCKQSGTASRFLLAALATQKGTFTLIGDTRLSQRPFQPLSDALQQQGAILNKPTSNNLPIILNNTDLLTGGSINIDAHKSSQFISALLMSAALGKKALTLKCSPGFRRSYIDMTCALMQEFGVEVIQPDAHTFQVLAPQSYQACHWTIEPDFSTASYFFAIAAITQGVVCINGLSIANSTQGDKNFLTILKKMGCHIVEHNNSLSVSGVPTLKGVNINMHECSDTFMTLVIAALFADSPSTITGIAHTRLQESDRIHAVCHNLKQLGIQTDEHEDGLTIYPGPMKGTLLSSFDDHRIAMAFSILGLVCPDIAIDGAEAVNKTFPDFYRQIDQI